MEKVQKKSFDAFLADFPDEAACQKYFEAIRFPNGVQCLHCGYKDVYRFQGGKRYRCAKCRKDFTLKMGTIFGESKIPLRKWFIAIYLLTTCKKGISSVVLAEKVGVNLNRSRKKIIALLHGFTDAVVKKRISTPRNACPFPVAVQHSESLP
jgi:transposase-like protein